MDSTESASAGQVLFGPGPVSLGTAALVGTKGLCDIG